MVTLVKKRGKVITKLYNLRGPSTEDKPSFLPNGSKFLETDTGKQFLFDEENKVWYERQTYEGEDDD